METSSPIESVTNLADSSQRLGRRILAICENRLQLLLVEAQEERERILRVIWMAMVGLTFAMLAGITITIIVAVAFWENHPIVALSILAVIYVIIAALFFGKLQQLQRDWQTLPATIEQLRKDQECLEKQLG
jgi:uncharacterized membrane protein YqjE